MAIEISVLGPDDADVLDAVAPEVFDHAVDGHLARAFLADLRHHMAVAVDGDTVVGMASAVDYVHPDKPVEMWINEVAVAPAYRGKGIGTRLVQTLLDVGRELGCRAAWVGTKGDNVAACRLYSGAGGEPEPFVMYTFNLAETVDD